MSTYQQDMLQCAEYVNYWNERSNFANLLLQLFTRVKFRDGYVASPYAPPTTFGVGLPQTTYRVYAFFNDAEDKLRITIESATKTLSAHQDMSLKGF